MHVNSNLSINWYSFRFISSDLDVYIMYSTPKGWIVCQIESNSNFHSNRLLVRLNLDNSKYFSGICHGKGSLIYAIILVMKAYRMHYFSKSSILNPLGLMGLFTSQNKNCVQVLIHMWTTNQWIYTLKLFKVVN